MALAISAASSATATGGAEEQAHHRRQLDVAHPHPARARERGEQQEPARGERRQQPRRFSPESSASPTAIATTDAGPVIRLGMIRRSRSMAAHGTSARTMIPRRTDAASEVWTTATIAASAIASATVATVAIRRRRGSSR